MLDSIGFFFIYIVNFIFEFYINYRKDEKIIEQNNESDKDIILINDSKSDYKKIEMEDKNDSEMNNYYKENINLPFDDNNNQISEKAYKSINNQEFIENKNISHTNILNQNNHFIRQINLKQKHIYQYLKENSSISIFWKIFYILIDFPLTFIRHLTIPNLENKEWNKTKFCLLPLYNFLFLSFSFNCKLKYIKFNIIFSV